MTEYDYNGAEFCKGMFLIFFSINPLPDDKILDWSKLKQITDDILKCIQNGNKVQYRTENIVRKGEIACYKQFLLFSQCFHFHSFISLVRQNAALCGEKLMDIKLHFKDRRVFMKKPISYFDIDK